MRFRTYKNTDLTVSEVGFGLWTISTGWWGNFTEGEAIALMHKAFDLGIMLFDAADTYGNGLSEELIAKAFPTQRDEIIIATKIGYDFVTHGDARGRGQREIPQDFSPAAVTRATEAGKDTMFLIRVTHSSGMLEGHYTPETIFPPTDHRSHRPRSWLLNGIKKVDQLRFLENSERTLGQAALQWLLVDDRVASTLPNIYNEEQLVEFAKAPECPPLTADDMAKIDELYSDNFGIEEEPAKFKGTMELPKETAVA